MVQTNSQTRLGLCLSGGGFRASFYHIGTLARMAEYGMLKHVEVISTVSGGSIVGAAYYLKLRNLLQKIPDKDLNDQHYVTLVSELEQEFLKATQKNLRLRLLGDVIRNIRMSFRNYSRSDAMGEIYDKQIYRKLIEGKTNAINMRDILIKPAGHEGDFHPFESEQGNAVRTHKVPILVVNSTSLNTGHNWCFTAVGMGEVPPINQYMRDLDKKDRYQRARYENIDPSKRKADFPLGKAIAASAGVPGMFPPLPVSHLYQDRTVQLVDGGVYDNQGITSALDPAHTCTDFVVSDACGQSEAIDNPNSSAVGSLSQSSSILMGRVREEVVNGVLESCGEDHVAYFHLKRGITARNIKFYAKSNATGADENAYQNAPETETINSLTAFGVSQEMQDALSEMRTDLDSFSNPEARSLEADAYLMSDSCLKKLPEKYRLKNKIEHGWAFKKYIPLLQKNSKQLLQHIKVGKWQFLKPYRLMRYAKFSKSLGLLAVSIPLFACLALYIYLAYLGVISLKNNEAFMAYTVADIVPWALTILGWFAFFMVIEKFSHRLAHSLQFIRSISRFPVFLIEHLLIPVLLFVPIKIYLLTVNPYYVNKIGELDEEEGVEFPGPGAVATSGGG